MAQLPKKMDTGKSRGASINKDIEAFISTPKKTPKNNKNGKMTKKPGSIKISDGRKNEAYQTMATFQKTNTDSFIASPTLGGRPTQMTNVKDEIYYQQTMHKTMTELDGHGAKYNSAEGGSTTQRDVRFTGQDQVMNSSMYDSERQQMQHFEHSRTKINHSNTCMLGAAGRMQIVDEEDEGK